MAEYALVATLIAIVALVALAFAGTEVSGMYSTIADSVAASGG